jgi:hypothetical protein
MIEPAGEGRLALRPARPRILSLSLLIGFGALLLVTACGPADDKRSSSQEALSVPDDAAAVRGIDFRQVGAVQTMLAQLGSAGIERADIIFEDLTGDQREEAVVPVGSGGSLGNVAYLVFTMKSGSPSLILTRTGDRSTASGLRMTVDHGVLQETVGVYGNEDPLCCPSQLRTTTFRWDGNRLQVDREITEAQAAGPKH